MYQGNKQKKAGEAALKNAQKPTYTIPQELLDNLSDAEKMQVEGLPAEQKKEFVQNIERSQQAAMKASADRKGGLLGLQSSMNQEANAYSNLVSMDASARKQSELNKQAAIQGARGDIAGAKNMAYGEQKDFYNQQVESAQANIGAGMQNINQGLQGIGSAAMQVGAARYKARNPSTTNSLGGGESVGEGSFGFNPSGARTNAALSATNLGMNNPGMIGNIF